MTNFSDLHQPSRLKCSASISYKEKFTTEIARHLSSADTRAQGTLTDFRASSHSRTPGRGESRVANSLVRFSPSWKARRWAVPQSRVHCRTCGTHFSLKMPG